MQKKIIALAVAGLVSGAAFAQSNVTIYGVVDTYYAHGSASNAKATESVNVLNAGGLSGSRLGFKGTEALGNGMSAVWTLEFGTLDQTVGDANNVGIDNTRQSFVGLTGGWGTAVAGRLQTPGYNSAVKYDAMGASIFSAAGQLSANNQKGGATCLSISGRCALARQNNAVAYVSPNMGGITVVGAYAFGTGGENTKDQGSAKDPQNIWALSVDYDAGPLSVGFAHHNVNDFQGNAGTDQTENLIGVNYDFGVAKLSGSYQWSKTETSSTELDKSRIWNIGARFPVGMGSVGVAYGNFRDKNMGTTDNDGKATSWGLDYQHNLSKRTTAYVGYTRVSNNDHLAYGLGNVASAPGNDGRESQFAVGLRHTF